MKLGRGAAGEFGGQPKPHALDEAGRLAVYRPTVDIDVVAVQSPHLLHHQRRSGGELAWGVDVPDVDAGWFLVLSRDDGKRRIAAVQGSVEELAQSLLCQRQE